MANCKYRVVRPHFGDKEYAEGDIRIADPGEVAHLVPKVLEPIAAPKPASAKASKKPRKR
jgi:hypothetical protein